MSFSSIYYFFFLCHCINTFEGLAIYICIFDRRDWENLKCTTNIVFLSKKGIFRRSEWFRDQIKSRNQRHSEIPTSNAMKLCIRIGLISIPFPLMQAEGDFPQALRTHPRNVAKNKKGGAVWPVLQRIPCILLGNVTRVQGVWRMTHPGRVSPAVTPSPPRSRQHLGGDEAGVRESVCMYVSERACVCLCMYVCARNVLALGYPWVFCESAWDHIWRTVVIFLLTWESCAYVRACQPRVPPLRERGCVSMYSWREGRAGRSRDPVWFPRLPDTAQ